MTKRTVLLLLITLLVIALPGCRSRRQAVVAPEPAPPITATAPEAAAPVEPARDFVQPESEEREVLSEDIVEANRVARERGWIRDAFFAFDESTLDSSAQAALTQSATWLRQNPEFRIRIEGHCDERGTEQYNLALGDRRAETAAAYLVTLGVERSRIETVSYGEQRPFETGSAEAAWAQNRRAHIVLTGRR